jgi:hypothetical protein
LQKSFTKDANLPKIIAPKYTELQLHGDPGRGLSKGGEIRQNLHTIFLFTLYIYLFILKIKLNKKIWLLEPW